MRYCARCVYPANARPAITFDDEGICSGCRTFEAKQRIQGGIDWTARWQAFKALLTEHAVRQRAKGNPYDCIIPVSGGKDSHWQVWQVKHVLGFNPLLVTFNHCMNTPLGIRNLANLLEKSDCHSLRFTMGPQLAVRLAKYMLKRVGDVTWHYHAGIMTLPAQVAVKWDIPLVIWGEEGFSELVGMHNLDDMVEFTRKKRYEHSMRGLEPDDILRETHEFTAAELAPFVYPSDAELERVGVRGIYLANYWPWDAREQAETMIREWGFETAWERERTFNVHAKLECIHADGLHDWLKYLKFGYGRATDDASNEIRHGRMTREEGIEMVMRYDHIRPSDTDVFLRAAGMTTDDLMDCVVPLRDPKAEYGCLPSTNDPGVEAARIRPKDAPPWQPMLRKVSSHASIESPQGDYVTL